MYNCKVKFKKQDYIKIMNPCLHNPKYLSQGIGLNFLTQCNMNYFFKYNALWKIWELWVCSLIPCIRTKGACKSSQMKLEQIQCEINLHKPREWLVQPKWCTHKPWTTCIHKRHHNIDLGGVTILFPIIQFINDNGAIAKWQKSQYSWESSPNWDIFV